MATSGEDDGNIADSEKDQKTYTNTKQKLPSSPNISTFGSNGSLYNNTANSSLRQTKDQRRQQRLRRNAEFKSMLANSTNLQAKTPPSSGAGSPHKHTPPHLRSFARAGQGRNFSSPPRTPPRGLQNKRPRPRAQTKNLISLGRGAAMQQQQGQQQLVQPNFQPHTYRPPQHGRIYSNIAELRIYVQKIPLSWTTWDLYQYLERFGSIAYIKIYPDRTLNKNAHVIFSPAPLDCSFASALLQGIGPDGRRYNLESQNDTREPPTYKSPVTQRTYPERMELPLLQLEFGVIKDELTMLVMHTATSSNASSPKLVLDLKSKSLFLTFSLRLPYGNMAEGHFKMKISPAQVCEASVEDPSEDETSALVLTLDMPPMLERRTSNVKATHEKENPMWSDRKAWFRQTDVDRYPLARNTAVQLQKDNCIIDIGRWLTYRLVFRKSRSSDDIFQALVDHNINIKSDKRLKYSRDHYGDPHALWAAMDPLPQNIITMDSNNSFLSDLQVMASDEANLPFDVRYRLEVCLSQGALHESNITKEFMTKLSAKAAADQLRVCKILEKVAESKTRYYEPEKIFALHNQVSVVEKKRPAYCTKIPSVNVTPSTVYYAVPVLETSNRVIRQFSKFEDHFLRVKFTDERYKGSIFPDETHHLDEMYSRIKRTMKHGITIGDRHYEFLAYGNSQFREHGAYFFASTPSLTAQMIRDWMGNFRNIKVVAKYCCRLGQCFSTTRAIPNTVNLRRIPDVERNGFCFTDGVGKLAVFLARLIASAFNIPNSDDDYPSMFQYRLAGCKGVLAVDPALKGRAMEIRPSQEKFAAEFYGLEICRISQFSAAYLNMQLILVLSALGVPDEVFIRKLRIMLADLTEAMTNEKKAIELLQKNIDFNQMTIALASLIFDGFMETQEPFVISCLRLWRSWSLKYLKEKARIYVDQGAFVLGGTDETQTLRGHFESKTDPTGILNPGAEIGENEEQKAKEDSLPEIFLQIPDPEAQGKYKVVEEVCVLARNPSLHPGDARVVRAVNVPALHHLKNCVILPQTGHRDLANMCSGGDLDGDDYLVMWDKDLLPREWNHPPMDYTAPPPVEAKGPVTVEDMTNFFVKHIKYDNLNRIAVAHRYWADAPDNPEGIKGDKCLQLAQLHSKAVDFAKTGVAAEMPEDLRVRRWPHWAEPKNKAPHQIYTSKKILGKLYDEVKREPFNAAWELPFDKRILTASKPSEQMLKDANEIKLLYDEAVRRIMAAHGIKTEFEVWTGFVLEHHQDINDYKFAENIGEIASVLRQQHQEMCYEKAGTTPQERDWEKMKPFIVAMYVVTAEEVHQAVVASKETITKGGQEVPVRPVSFDNMPFMSFPWLFARELGLIATKSNASALIPSIPRPTAPRTAVGAAQKKQAIIDLLGDVELAQLPEVNTEEGPVKRGEVLPVRDDVPSEVPEWAKAFGVVEKKTLQQETPPALPATPAKENAQPPAPTVSITPPTPVHVSNIPGAFPASPVPFASPEAVSDAQNAGDGDGDDEVEQITITFDDKPSALDRLEDWYGDGED